MDRHEAAPGEARQTGRHSKLAVTKRVVRQIVFGYTHLQIGYTTWGMPRVPVDRALSFLHEQGFDAVELTVLPNYTTAVDRLDAGERQRIKERCDGYGLAMPAVAAHRSLLDEDSDAHRENMRVLKRAVDLCAGWSDGRGAPVLDTVLGGAPEDWEPRRDFIYERVRELVEYAAARNVVIGMEAHVGSALDTAEKSVELVEIMGSPHLGLNFDISHFDVLGMSIDEAVRLMAPHAVHTHVKDQRGLVPDFEFLVPGEGDFDFAAYLRAMHAAGYEGSITAEVSNMVQMKPGYDPFEAAALCYRTLEKAFAEAGVPRT